jgi:hypothetical protein
VLLLANSNRSVSAKEKKTDALYSRSCFITTGLTQKNRSAAGPKKKPAVLGKRHFFVKYTTERVSSDTKSWLCHALAPAYGASTEVAKKEVVSVRVVREVSRRLVVF